MPDSERKIDEMRDMLHELRPVVFRIAKDTESIETRMRASEMQGAAHDVKIERLKEDVDGLGRKVRGIEVRGNLAAAVAPEKEPGKWATIAEFLGALPAYWHAVGYVAAAALGSFFAMLERHKP